MKSNKEIQEELEELAPGFSWPEKYPDFDVPAGYFSEFPGQVRNTIQLLSTEEIYPELDKQNPYKIPDNYFDNLPQAVLKKVKKDTPIIQLPRPHRHWPVWASAAAIAVLVALSALLMFQRNQYSGIDRQLASISNTAIEQYLNSETDISTPMENQDTHKEGNLPETAISKFSDKAIETYLMNNVPDTL